MFILTISEWIANLLVLGVAVVMWGIGLFIIAMILSMLNKFIKEHT